MENTYRDVNIALANQIAELADTYGIDVTEAVRIANGHPRVEYLSPGIGVGGHCIPVDPWFLVSGDHIDDGLIGTARTINDRQPSRVADAIAAAVSGDGRAEVLLLGAAYKRDVGDMRNSPALAVAEALRNLGVGVRMYDPHVREYAGDLGHLAAGADALVVLVPHRLALAELSKQEAAIRARMRQPVLLDASSGTVRPLML
jgi:UDP-N-acetyl-D-mannosaminuronic acid dehydrogenase